MKSILSVFLFCGLAISQTTEPVVGTITIPAGTFESPLVFHLPLSRAGNDVTCPGCGGSSGGGTIGSPSLTTINLYISPSGSDTAACSTAAPCKTLAHVLGTVPALLTQPYQINVADGTYSEPVDLRGYSGMALSVIGDTTTPANVSFTGIVVGCDSPRFTSTTTVVCMQGRGVQLFVAGITANAAVRQGITCDGCAATLLNVSATGMNTVGIENESGYLNLQGTITVSGFALPSPSNNTFGIYNGWGGHIVQNDGTVTVTGPGWAGGLISYGVAEEFASSYTMLPRCDTCSTLISITLSNVLNGFQLTGHSILDSFVSTGSLTMTNTTNSGGHGLDLYNSSAADFVGGPSGMNLTINNFGYCISGYVMSEMSDGPGNRTLSNCTATNAQQGSTFILF